MMSFSFHVVVDGVDYYLDSDFSFDGYERLKLILNHLDDTLQATTCRKRKERVINASG